uniref:Probable RNA polymerase II nuclear localization protein SLC7A6OS n=2 Tax=Schistocephalus solidus TaxID=70667 RepID=A0A0X3PYW0_SCHSO
MENTSPGDSKRTKTEVDSSTLLLRVKRPFSEPPVECFNTVPYKKRCQWYPEVKKVKCFRYVGSTTLDEGGLDALQDMGAVGARRIFWTSTSTACVINPEDEKKIDFQVHLSAAKRRLSPSPSSSPKRRSRSPLEVIATLPTESGPSSSKCLRVIDLESCSSSAPATDPLAITMNGLRLVATPVEPPKVESEVSTMASDNNFVYDVYRIDPGARTQYPNSAEGSDLERSPHQYVYVDVEDAEYKNDGEIFDDDSDSNSESNWRNDYPDDDDEFAYLDKDDENSEDDDNDNDYNDTSDEDDELSRHRPYQSRRVLFSGDPFASLLL